MGVSKINSSNSNRLAELPVRPAQQNFGNARYGYLGKLDVERALSEASGRGVRAFKFFGGDGAGEIFNTFMTALGTAVVAPIFIVYNPIAKEDRETRVYSAWRQPISAVVAIAFQYTVNKAFNSYFARKASLGAYEGFDLRSKPRESYLISTVKKEAKKAGKKLTPEEITQKVDAIRLEAFNKELARATAHFGDKLPAYRDLVDPKLYEDIEKVVLKDEKFIKGLADLPKRERLAKIDAKIYAAAVKKVEASLIQSAKRKHYIVQMQEQIASGRAKNFDEAYIILKQVERQKYLNDGARKLLKGEKLALKKQVRNSEMRLVEGNGFFTPELKFDKSIRVSLAEFYLEFKANLGDLKDALEDTRKSGCLEEINKTGKTFQEILSHQKIEEFVKVSIKKAEATFKKYNKSWGIVVSLVTLPFSCGLLNWAYPRIMEHIMPEAAKAKKQKYEYSYPGSTKVKPLDLQGAKMEVAKK